MLLLLLFSLAGAACAGSATDEPSDQPAAADQPEAEESATTEQPAAGANATLMRGTVMHDGEVPTFRPCDSDESLTIADNSGRIAELHAELATGLAPNAGLFAILEGTRTEAPAGDAGAGDAGAEAAGALQIENILYFGFEGSGCGSDWDFAYRARGNEPFWMVQVDDNELRLTRPAEEDLLWPAFETIERDEGPTYRALETEELPEAILTLRVDDCRDSMSGAYFGYAATFEFGEESFSGCALAGDR